MKFYHGSAIADWHRALMQFFADIMLKDEGEDELVILFDKLSLDSMACAMLAREHIKMHATMKDIKVTSIPSLFLDYTDSPRKKSFLVFGHLFNKKALANLAKKAESVFVFDPYMTSKLEVADMYERTYPKLTWVYANDYTPSEFSSMLFYLDKGLNGQGSTPEWHDLHMRLVQTTVVPMPDEADNVLSLRGCSSNFLWECFKRAHYNPEEYAEHMQSNQVANRHFYKNVTDHRFMHTAKNFNGAKVLTSNVPKGYGPSVAMSLASLPEGDGVGLAICSVDDRVIYYLARAKYAPHDLFDIAGKNKPFGDRDLIQFHIPNDPLEKLFL